MSEDIETISGDRVKAGIILFVAFLKKIHKESNLISIIPDIKDIKQKKEKVPFAKKKIPFHVP